MIAARDGLPQRPAAGRAASRDELAAYLGLPWLGSLLGAIAGSALFGGTPMAALFWLTFGLVAALVRARAADRRRAEPAAGMSRPRDEHALSIVHAIARLNVGGAALHVIELAARQRARGHDVVIVAGTLAEGEESMEYVAHDLGVPVVRLPALQRELSPLADATAVRELRRTVTPPRRGRAPHAHRQGGRDGTARRRARRGGTWPRATVHTFHGHVLSGYFGTRRERVFIQLERLLARRTGAIVAVSDEVRDDLVRLGVAPPEKIVVIPYGFDLSGLSRARRGRAGARRTAIGLPAGLRSSSAGPGG